MRPAARFKELHITSTIPVLTTLSQCANSCSYAVKDTEKEHTQETHAQKHLFVTSYFLFFFYFHIPYKATTVVMTLIKRSSCVCSTHNHNPVTVGRKTKSEDPTSVHFPWYIDQIASCVKVTNTQKVLVLFR